MVAAVFALRPLLGELTAAVRLPALIVAAAAVYAAAVTLIERGVWDDFRRLAARADE